MRSKTIKPIDPGEQFPLVEKMLYDLSWKASRATGGRLSFEDARSEACVAFMKICETYDPTRGIKFSSWCYFKVWAHLKTYVTGLARSRMIYVDPHKTYMKTIPEEEKPKTFGEELSIEAREILKLLVDTPRELLELLPKRRPRALMERVKRYVGYNKGYSWRQVNRAELEIFYAMFDPV